MEFKCCLSLCLQNAKGQNARCLNHSHSRIKARSNRKTCRQQIWRTEKLSVLKKKLGKSFLGKLSMIERYFIKATIANHTRAAMYRKKSSRQISLHEVFIKEMKISVVHHCGIHCRMENVMVFLFRILR